MDAERSEFALDSPDADGQPCPECGVPFGDRPDELAPACWYCLAANGQPCPPLNPPAPPAEECNCNTRTANWLGCPVHRAALSARGDA